MKLLLISILVLMTQTCFAQALKLNYYCSDVKIISVYTGDTISRCEFFLKKEVALKKLGSDLNYELREVASDPLEFYPLGELVNDRYRDFIEYSLDSSNVHGVLGIFSKKIKVLIDNKYLIQVGDNIEQIFKEYTPIPIREDPGFKESSVYIYYESKSHVENIIKGCILAIKFDNKTKIIYQIIEFIDPGV